MSTPSETTSDFANARPYVSLGTSVTTPSSRLRLAFLRAIVWSLVGMIYAPLFTGLAELMSVAGLGFYAYPLAAGLAGAVGAVLYGARELALISSGIGAAAGVAVLIVLSGQVTLTTAVLIASGLAAVVGLTVSFPQRCSRHVPGKLLAGLMAGVFGGALLAVAEHLHPAQFSALATVAFLVSVSAILYVGSVGGWVALSRRLRLEGRSCYIVESAIMAILAGVAAGSVWMVAAPLLGTDAGAPQMASVSMHYELQGAVLGGLLGGALAGLLLETFRFSWVNDL